MSRYSLFALFALLAAAPATARALPATPPPRVKPTLTRAPIRTEKPRIRTSELDHAARYRHVKAAPSGRVVKKLSDKTLFRTGAAARDVGQGSFEGDCFLLSTLAATAHLNPTVIENLFVRNKDGSLKHDSQGRLSVRFYRKQKGGRFRAEIVLVDAKLPVDKDGKLVFAQARQRKLWVAVLEKAFAEFQDKKNALRAKYLKPGDPTGYGAIDGGSARLVMEALTGRPAATLRPSANPKSADRIYAAIKAATENGQLVVAGSIVEADQAKRAEQARASGLIPGRASAKLSSLKLVEGHDYSVFGVTEVGGKRFIVLRNPWGSGAARRDKGLAGLMPRAKDGTFLLPLERFTQFYDEVYIGAKVTR